MIAKTWAAALTAVFLVQGAGLTAAAEPQTVKVGVNGVISDAPIFIAKDRGYFKEEGISVTFVQFNTGPKMVAPLGTGELDVAAGASSAGLFNAVARGITIKVVADKGSTPPGPSYMPLIVRKDLIDSGRVKTLADLKGLKIGVAGKGGSPESTLNEILKKGGLTMSDITLMQSIGYPEQVAALEHKSIDASITTEPSVTKAVEGGVAARFSDGSAYPNQEVAMLLYSGNFIAKRPGIAEKFMIAYVRGVRVFNDAVVDGHFKGKTAPEVIDTIIRNGRFKDKALFAKMVVNGCDPDGRINVASLRKDLEFFKSRGYVEGKVTVDDVVDSSFVEKAVAKLGAYHRAE